MPTAPASPCINICKLDQGVCQGCGRSLDEIAHWAAASPDVKRIILAAAKGRLSARRSASPPRHA